MSIKTTKRIALGVIASLVFAPFAAIAPASATVGTYTPTLTSGTTSLTGSGTATASATGAVGTAVNFNLVVTGSGTPTAGDDVVITPVLTGTATTQGNANARTALTVANLAVPTNTLVNMTSTISSGVITNVTTTTAAASATHNYTFTPDVTGTYIFTFTPTLSGGTPAAAVFTYIATAKDGSIYATADSTGSLSNLQAATGVAGPNNFVTITQTALASTAYNVVVTGSTATVVSGANATGTGTSSVVTAINTATVMNIPTPTVGTITVRNFPITNGVQSATASSTVTITVQDPAITGSVSTTTSTSVIKTGATWAAGSSATTDDVVSVTRTVTEPNAPTSVIKVTLGQVQGAITTSTAVTASITGPGLLALNDQNDVATSLISTGRSISSTVATTTETFHVFVYPDGTSGTSTITITVGGFTATETVRFFGAPTSYTATVVQGTVTANGTATTDAILVAATDANGVAVPGHTIYAYSSDATVATVETSDATEATAIATSGTRPASFIAATPVGSVAFNVTGLAGKSGAVTITFGNATTLAASTVTTTARVTVSELKANSIVLTSDKATYLPGELITITLTARDKNGNPIADGPGTALLAGSLVASQAITSTLFAADVATRNGIATATFYAPLVEGTVVLTGTVGAAGTYVETAYAATRLTLSIPVARPAVVVPEVYEKPTLSVVESGGRVFLSGTAVEGEGDIIIYVKRVGTTTWKERAKTLEVAAPGDFNGSIKAPRGNVVIRVKQEGTGMFSNQVILVK